MKSYLSIDLDYWMYDHDQKESVKFFKKVFQLGLPITVVKTHEQMLPHINELEVDTVFNVDYHSDIFGFETEEDLMSQLDYEPNEGSWGNYVKWRREACFHWMYPELRCYNREDNIGGSCWTCKGDNPYIKGVLKEWRKCKRNHGTKNLDWNSVVAIGVAQSPSYYTKSTVVAIYKTLGIHKKGFGFKPYIFDTRKNQKKVQDFFTSWDIMFDLEEDE